MQTQVNGYYRGLMVTVTLEGGDPFSKIDGLLARGMVATAEAQARKPLHPLLEGQYRALVTKIKLEEGFVRLWFRGSEFENAKLFNKDDLAGAEIDYRELTPKAEIETRFFVVYEISKTNFTKNNNPYLDVIWVEDATGYTVRTTRFGTVTQIDNQTFTVPGNAQGGDTDVPPEETTTEPPETPPGRAGTHQGDHQPPPENYQQLAQQRQAALDAWGREYRALQPLAGENKPPMWDNAWSSNQGKVATKVLQQMRERLTIEDWVSARDWYEAKLGWGLAWLAFREISQGHNPPSWNEDWTPDEGRAATYILQDAHEKFVSGVPWDDVLTWYNSELLGKLAELSEPIPF